MNLAKIPTRLFRLQKTQRREDYIQASLSSLALSSRLYRWPGHRDSKSKPLILEFYWNWLHANCNVIEWYNLIAPSTQLVAIEHRKTLEAPFFHEFLLIHLTDGSVCRLERMGDGSRVGAVRRLGCTAHDIIQWFRAGQYINTPLGQQPSSVVIHVQFPRHFDLLDILAICYSIKQHPQASLYTLQRYNCYFLCNTILAILSRRVAKWETKLVTPETWPKIVDHVLEELPRQKHNDAFDYCGIGVCSLLEPDCQNLVSRVVGLLRSELKASAHHSIAIGIANSLWHRNLPSAIQASLLDHVNVATTKALISGNAGAVGLATLLGGGNNTLYPDTELRDPLIQRIILKEQISEALRFTRQNVLCSYRTYKMRQIEVDRGPSKSTELLASIIGPIVAWWLFDMDAMKSIPGVGGKIDAHIWAQIQMVRISIAISFGKTGVLTGLDDDFNVAWDEESDKITHDVISSAYSLYRLPVIDTRSKALRLLNLDLDREKWSYSLRYCICRLLMEVPSVLSCSSTITVLTPEQPSFTILDLQGHFQRRIKEHAQRVDTYGLAAAQLVEEDIERVMDEIWKALPVGFGGVKNEE